MQVVYETEEKWLASRGQGIGGSDSACIVGANPYKSNIELWEEKVGLREPDDISSNPKVKYGKLAEKHLVSLFALDYPEYEVNYNDNCRVNYCDAYPFVYCTRDCDLVDRRTGEKGALEIKTTTISSRIQAQQWEGRIPENYYCQVLQYFITDPEIKFVIVKAQLRSGIAGDKLETRHYWFYRDDKTCREDGVFLLNEEIKFWKQFVLKKKRPARLLPNI